MSIVANTAMFAHQGGWDEILLVVGPMAVIAGLLVLAKRRVDAAASNGSTGESTGGPAGATDDQQHLRG